MQNSIKGAAQFFTRDGVLQLFPDRIQAGIDFCRVDGRAQHPGAQQALAHGGSSRVDATEQSDSNISARVQRLDQLEVADSYGIENQAVLALVKPMPATLLRGPRRGERTKEKTASTADAAASLPNKPKPSKQGTP